jgi:D-sedoheptulose 7-phosphate isomerase
MSEFLEKYFSGFKGVLDHFLSHNKNRENLEKVVGILKELKGSKSGLYLIGNGGSAAIAEHMAVDFIKCNKIRAITFSGTPLITCFANDYGHEFALQKAIEKFANAGDVLVAISSSGTSKNILNACDSARKIGMTIITFSGFAEDNPLNGRGDYNFWVDSRSYGYLEMAHNVIIHYINDATFGKIEYYVKD